MLKPFLIQNVILQSLIDGRRQRQTLFPATFVMTKWSLSKTDVHIVHTSQKSYSYLFFHCVWQLSQLLAMSRFNARSRADCKLRNTARSRKVFCEIERSEMWTGDLQCSNMPKQIAKHPKLNHQPSTEKPWTTSNARVKILETVEGSVTHWWVNCKVKSDYPCQYTYFSLVPKDGQNTDYITTTDGA